MGYHRYRGPQYRDIAISGAISYRDIEARYRDSPVYRTFRKSGVRVDRLSQLQKRLGLTVLRPLRPDTTRAWLSQKESTTRLRRILEPVMFCLLEMHPLLFLSMATVENICLVYVMQDVLDNLLQPTLETQTRFCSFVRVSRVLFQTWSINEAMLQTVQTLSSCSLTAMRSHPLLRFLPSFSTFLQQR